MLDRVVGWRNSRKIRFPIDPLVVYRYDGVLHPRCVSDLNVQKERSTDGDVKALSIFKAIPSRVILLPHFALTYVLKLRSKASHLIGISS